ncbi:MAG: ribosome hibernation-promoting factor, HPF/YfiA family [Planctomycetota bacterium]|jgi:ribosomal subunit interface protein
MKINVSGRHLTVSPQWEEYAAEKAEKLGKYFAGIQHVDFVLEENGKEQRVEMSVVLGQGARLMSKADSDEMMTAIDQAESKIQKQMRRFHAKLKAHRDRTRVADGAPPPSEEELASYEQVIQEMLEEDVG